MSIETVNCDTCRREMQADTDELAFFFCDECNANRKATFRAQLTQIWEGKAPATINDRQIDAPPSIFYKVKAPIWSNVDAARQRKILPFLNSEHYFATFMGPVGTLKSWTAWATVFAHHLKHFGRSSIVVVTDWSDLCRAVLDLSDFNFSMAARKKLDRARDAGLLVVDEFGTAKPSHREFREIYDLINDRHRNQRHTLITTTQDMAGLAESMDNSTRSRFEGGLVVPFNGNDLRLSGRENPNS